jgi:hypothetical protein
MKCDKCNNSAYTMLDMACDKCGIRICRECASVYKCYYCRIPYCECYGVFCPNERTHDWITHRSCYVSEYDDYYSPEQNVTCTQESLDKLYTFWNIFDDDTEFVNFITKYDYDKFLFKCCDRQVVKAGKLSVDLARYIVEKLNWHNDSRLDVKTIGNEGVHRELDKLWKWYLQSMDKYTIDEARQIAKIILDVNRSQFWYE